VAEQRVIVHKGNPGLRIAYVECEVLDPLFDGIGQLIGTPVEPIVVGAVRPGTRDYVRPMMPAEVRDLARSKESLLMAIINAMALTVRINGSGRIEFKEMRYEYEVGDFVTFISGDPYSVLLLMGDIAGASEAITGNEHDDYVYTKIAPALTR